MQGFFYEQMLILHLRFCMKMEHWRKNSAIMKVVMGFRFGMYRRPSCNRAREISVNLKPVISTISTMQGNGLKSQTFATLVPDIKDYTDRNRTSLSFPTLSLAQLNIWVLRLLFAQREKLDSCWNYPKTLILPRCFLIYRQTFHLFKTTKKKSQKKQISDCSPASPQRPAS